MEKDIEKLLDGVKIPSDEEVEAAGMRFDRRIRRLRMRRRVMRVTGSVAAVLCCGFVFAFLWMNRGTKENIGVAEDCCGRKCKSGAKEQKNHNI